jgi:hypothetical protein
MIGVLISERQHLLSPGEQVLALALAVLGFGLFARSNPVPRLTTFPLFSMVNPGNNFAQGQIC